MKKILFVLGSYKPRMSANGVCCDAIMHALKDDGYSVSCIANNELNSPCNDNFDGISVYRVKTRLTYRLVEWCEYNKNNKSERLIRKLAFVFNKCKLFLTAMIWPLVSPLYTFRFYQRAKTLHKENHYDVVIGVYTPIDSLYAAHLLKKEFPDIKFVAYFLDSLSGGYGPRWFNEKQTIKRGLKWEKRLLNNADKIVVMKSSEEQHKKYNASIIDKFNVLDIPLLSCNNIVQKKRDNLNIKLVFVGSIKKSMRNPKFMISILEAISTFNIEVDFIGDIDCMDMFDILKVKYQNRIHFLGRVSHEESLQNILMADVLLNIGNNNPSMVPSKIFEYMSALKPIISTLPISKEPSAQYLKKYPIALLIDEHRSDFPIIAKEILSFIDDSKNVHFNYDDLKKIFFNNMPEAFVKIINNIK